MVTNKNNSLCVLEINFIKKLKILWLYVKTCDQNHDTEQK